VLPAGLASIVKGTKPQIPIVFRIHLLAEIVRRSSVLPPIENAVGGMYRGGQGLGDALARKRIVARGGVSDRDPACPSAWHHPCARCSEIMQALIRRVVAELRDDSGSRELIAP